MFYYLSHIFTEWWIDVNKLDYEESYDKLEMEFRGNIHGIVTIIVCLLFAYWIGIFIESVLILIIYQCIRFIIGGAHWNLEKCLVITVFSTLMSAKVGSLATEHNKSLLYILLFISFYMVGYMPYFKDKLEYDAEKLTYKKYSRIMIILLTIIFICDSINILTVTNSIAMAFVMILVTSKKWLKY